MSDVKVTREHRLLALEAVYGTTRSQLSHPPLAWAASGEAMRGQFTASARVADALASAEHRIRAAIIADLRGLVSRAHRADFVNLDLVVDVNHIEDLIGDLEAQS